MRHETEFCWKQSQRDLETARRKLGNSAYYVCAFMSQRAVEQALKAVIVEQTRRAAPQTHNLANLGQYCKLPKKLKPSLTALKQEYLTALSPNGIPTAAFTEKTASHYLQCAERIVEWCQKKLEPRPAAVGMEQQ